MTQRLSRVILYEGRAIASKFVGRERSWNHEANINKRKEQDGQESSEKSE